MDPFMIEQNDFDKNFKSIFVLASLNGDHSTPYWVKNLLI